MSIYTEYNIHVKFKKIHHNTTRKKPDMLQEHRANLSIKASSPSKSDRNEYQEYFLGVKVASMYS
jgi:hypothetical protein